MPKGFLEHRSNSKVNNQYLVIPQPTQVSTSPGIPASDPTGQLFKRRVDSASTNAKNIIQLGRGPTCKN